MRRYHFESAVPTALMLVLSVSCGDREGPLNAADGPAGGNATGTLSPDATEVAVNGNGSNLPVPGASGQAAAGTTECVGLSNRRLRRLSVREYTNVVSRLLGPELASQVPSMLPHEPTLGGFDNQESALIVSSAFQEGLALVADRLSHAIDPNLLFPCQSVNEADCPVDFAASFAQVAYGRAPTPVELDRLLQVAAIGQDYAASVRLVVEVVLQSPNTLYVSELGAPDAVPAAGVISLTQEEIASQLAFLLTGNRPDEALLGAAVRGELGTPAQLSEQVGRLLVTDDAERQLMLFLGGWLDMAPIADAPKDPEVFPELTAEVVGAMQLEFDTFLTQRIARGEGTLAGLLLEPSADVPQELAPIYADDLTAGGLDPARRGGVLSLPGVLTYQASTYHSSPVTRGLWVRRQLLCQEVPPPPPDVLDQITQNPIEIIDGAMTTRQRFEAHLTEARCSVCHMLFDPIGFGLEQFDGIGRFRTTENGLPIDASGALNGTDVDGPFTGAVELAGKLAESELFAECFVEHFFRFSQARAAEAADVCVVDQWNQQFELAGGHLRDLVLASVTSPTFVQRIDDR